MSAGRQAAPPPRDPGIPLPRTLCVPWYLCYSSCILEPVCSFPNVSCVCPPISLIHSGTLERLQFSGLLPRLARTRFPPWGWLAPFHLAALGAHPPPALALSLQGPHLDSRCLSLSPRLQGGCGAAFGSLSAPHHPKVFCLLCSVEGRSPWLALKLNSHIFG